MTDDATAALAAAIGRMHLLGDWPDDDYWDDAAYRKKDGEAEVAAHIIAALAAAGYRITNEPPLTAERLAAALRKADAAHCLFAATSDEETTVAIAILAALTSEEPT